jgi:hypothetical protein
MDDIINSKEPLINEFANLRQENNSVPTDSALF